MPGSRVYSRQRVGKEIFVLRRVSGIPGFENLNITDTGAPVRALLVPLDPRAVGATPGSSHRLKPLFPFTHKAAPRSLRNQG